MEIQLADINQLESINEQGRDREFQKGIKEESLQLTTCFSGDQNPSHGFNQLMFLVLYHSDLCSNHYFYSSKLFLKLFISFVLLYDFSLQVNTILVTHVPFVKYFLGKVTG